MRHDDESRSADDLTPEVGAATDVAPLGRAEIKPAHELTAAEDSDPVDWRRVTQMPEVRAMVRAKLRFIIPAEIHRPEIGSMTGDGLVTSERRNLCRDWLASSLSLHSCS